MDEVFGAIAATLICGGLLAVIMALLGWMLMGIVAGMRRTARGMANHVCEDRPQAVAFHGIDEDREQWDD